MSNHLEKKSNEPIFKQIINLIPRNLFYNLVKKHQTANTKMKHNLFYC